MISRLEGMSHASAEDDTVGSAPPSDPIFDGSSGGVSARLS